MRFAFAGDRDIAVWVLEFLHSEGFRPEALIVSGPNRASHAAQLERMCDYLPAERVLRGSEFQATESLEMLASLDLDLLVAIHFPYIVPGELLAIPSHGVVNLHPAFLPFNRGMHTPSWAILEDTPIGATLHFMDVGLDTGDVIHQRQLRPSPSDTAHTLYARLKELELEVFREAWPALASGSFGRTPQDPAAGTFHKRSDLSRSGVQEIDLEKPVRPAELLRQLRALTTDRADEAAYFEIDGRRYRVQVTITEEPPQEP